MRDWVGDLSLDGPKQSRGTTSPETEVSEDLSRRVGTFKEEDLFPGNARSQLWCPTTPAPASEAQTRSFMGSQEVPRALVIALHIIPSCRLPGFSTRKRDYSLNYKCVVARTYE